MLHKQARLKTHGNCNPTEMQTATQTHSLQECNANTENPNINTNATILHTYIHTLFTKHFQETMQACNHSQPGSGCERMPGLTKTHCAYASPTSVYAVPHFY